MAFQYNTGSFGTFFNDGSVMVLHPENTKFEYFERKGGKEVRETCSVDTYPSELKKKLNLLQYFTNYMPSRCESLGPAPDTPAAAARVAGQPVVIVRKYLKTRHAIFFRLSDNTMQARECPPVFLLFAF